MRKVISLVTLLAFFCQSLLAQQLILKSSSAYALGPILMIDSSDHVTGKTGCTSPTVKKISKNFGSATTPSGTWTQLDSTNFPGVYYLTANTTDVGSDGIIIGHFECSGADPWDGVLGQVVEFDPRGTTPTAADVATATLSSDLSGFSTTGTAGKALKDIDTHTDTEIASIKTKTDSLNFTVSGQVDSNVTNWKGSTAPANTGDAFARLGAPAGASVSADVAAVNAKTTNLPASPASTTNISAGTITNLTNAPTAGDLTATMKASVRTAASPAIQKGVAFKWAVQFKSIAGLLVTTGTPTCLRSIDNRNNFLSGTLSASAVTSRGLSEISFATGDVNGDDYVLLTCTLSGATDQYQQFRIQK